MRKKAGLALMLSVTLMFGSVSVGAAESAPVSSGSIVETVEQTVQGNVDSNENTLTDSGNLENAAGSEVTAPTDTPEKEESFDTVPKEEVSVPDVPETTPEVKEKEPEEPAVTAEETTPEVQEEETVDPTTVVQTIGRVSVQADGRAYVSDENGNRVTTAGTPVIDGKKYYIAGDGYLVTGWLYLENWKMYFSPEDYTAQVGIYDIKGKKYLFNDDGVMQNYAGTTVIDGKKYWFSTDDASLGSGWLHLGNWKMYFDPVTYEAKTGLVNIEGEAYLFNSDGVMQGYAGTPVINGKKYWFASEGYLRFGWLHLGNWKMYFDPKTYEARTGLTNIEGHTYIFSDDGVMQGYAGTPVINGKKYWVTPEGYLNSGWLYLGNWKMYFDPTTFTVKTGLTDLNGKKYLFNSDGVMQNYAGTTVINGKKYWFSDDDASLNSGWLKLANWTMYFDPTTYQGAVGLTTISGTTYYFNKDGVMVTGLVDVKGTYYYFDSNGAMVKNATRTVNGIKLKFGSNGACTSILPESYRGPYKITVDRTNCVVTVYGDDGSGQFALPVKAFVCSVGLSSTPTPKGTFYTGSQAKVKELMGPSWGQYSTHIVNGVYFHSVATPSASDPGHNVPAGEYYKLGSPASHGCVRLLVGDAYWIYTHISAGTKVVIGDNLPMPLGKPSVPKMVKNGVDPTDPFNK